MFRGRNLSVLTATKGVEMKPLTEEQQATAEEAMSLVKPSLEYMCRMYPGIRLKLMNMDAESIAALAVCKAARSYDESKGAMAGYFGTAIRNEVLKSLERDMKDTLDKGGRVPLFDHMTFTQDHNGPLRVAISTLAEEDLCLIRMRYWYCLSYPEIARQSGYSESTMRRRVAAALDLLRIALGMGDEDSLQQEPS